MNKDFFNHIGITVNNPSEIKDFYIDLLKMEKLREFTINPDTSSKIFDIKKEIKVVIVSRDNLTLELFCYKCAETSNYNHTCITVENRDILIREAQEKNYTCKIIKREPYDLVFIKDKSNNIFEIKTA
jgi:catechol 2,3-dioxygenase-like lactoylglutathione lyase family enzyme